MRCSALISPAVLSAQRRTALERRLIRVAIRQAGLELAADAPALEVLASLHRFLLEQSELYPVYDWEGTLPCQTPPNLLPGLVALIGLEDDLIVVMPRVDRSLLSDTDWDAVAKLVSDDFSGVMLTTPWQLRLVAAVELAMHLYIRSFDLVWGSDVLAGLQPTEQHVMVSAAALPLRILVEQLPAAYLTVEESGLDRLIHDVHNTLLNVQLHGELLARRKGTAVPRPPEPPPGQEPPPHQRIAAAFQHLRWWAELLTADVEAVDG